jgi:23S rRNA (uracil1939-C5)-methyltransferase
MGYASRQRGGYGGRRGHGKGFKRRPVELGEELAVDITELSLKEEGIARVQGWVIHVPNAKPGEHVKVKITQMGDKTAHAEIVK